MSCRAKKMAVPIPMTGIIAGTISRYQTICLLGAFFPAAPAAFTPAVAPNPNPDPDPKVELVVELPIPPVPADPAVPTPPEFGPATPLGFGFECPGV